MTGYLLAIVSSIFFSLYAIPRKLSKLATLQTNHSGFLFALIGIALIGVC